MLQMIFREGNVWILPKEHINVTKGYISIVQIVKDQKKLTETDKLKTLIEILTA